MTDISLDIAATPRLKAALKIKAGANRPILGQAHIHVLADGEVRVVRTNGHTLYATAIGKMDPEEAAAHSRGWLVPLDVIRALRHLDAAYVDESGALTLVGRVSAPFAPIPPTPVDTPFPDYTRIPEVGDRDNVPVRGGFWVTAEKLREMAQTIDSAGLRTVRLDFTDRALIVRPMGASEAKGHYVLCGLKLGDSGAAYVAPPEPPAPPEEA